MNEVEIQHEDDLLIINDVARAVEEHEFVPYVQPCYALDPVHVMAGEVLARWTLPEDGTVVPAGAFVPSLERTNTICGLDWFIASEMCAFLEQAAGTAALLPVALNISNQHADDPDFASKLAATADWHKIDHRYLSIELSQELIAGDERVGKVLVSTMVEQGFGVIADNFCVGPDALRPLKDAGIITVKVSAKLWREGEAEDLAAVVAAAKELGMVLVAEGVETKDELRTLKDMGIAYAQGYHLARPMSLDAYTALCAE